MENIDDFSRVVLIDFGLAKRFADPIEKEDKKMGKEEKYNTVFSRTLISSS